MLSIDLIKSEKWRQLLESTAAALQIGLVFFSAGTQEQFSVCSTCPCCGCELQAAAFLNLSEKEGVISSRGAQPQDREIFVIDEKYSVAAQDYMCCHNVNAMAFHERVRFAKQLLVNFYDILIGQLNSEQLAKELAVLHQINHIVISLLRSGHNARERVADLILSACVIIFDAKSSWLEYSIEERQYYRTKGSYLPGSECYDSINSTVTVEIHNPMIRVRFGIISPVDLERTDKLLDFMVNECVIVFEMDTLLKLLESKVSQFFNAIDNMIMLVDRNKNICFANKAASQLLSRPIHELIALPVDEIDAPWLQVISSDTENATKGIKDPLLCCNDEKYIDWDVYPLHKDIGILGWLIMARDCTDFYRLQDLDEKTENLVHASTLLRVIVHEIRNPISTFKGLLQVINLKSGMPEIGKYVSIGLNEIKKISLLLDEFSQFGKMAETSLEKTDMKAFMDEVFNLVTAGFNGPDIEIVSFYSATTPVMADKSQLTQAIFNLVKNAYEALNSRGKITLCLNQQDRDWVEIKVSDNGPGIPENIKDKLFKPYFTTKADGTGLGLAIANSIVHNHNGKMSVLNNAHGGACFSILLPSGQL